MSRTKSLHEFFLVALPGLEDLVLAETKEWFPDLDAQLEHGGVTVMASLNDGLGLNLVLKTPTRILLRLATFRCRDFPKLYNKVLAMPWTDWVDPTCELEVHASTRLSRLKIKSRITDACLDAWMDYRKKLGVSAVRGKKVSLYIRFVDDECTLSLDTSGERLHKRGTRQFIGDAPLRETIAAALIQMVGRNYPTEPGRAVELVDPMMGSGTFILEAAMRDVVVDARSFAFESFTAKPDSKPVLAVKRIDFVKLIGYEVDSKALSAAKGNIKNLPKKIDLDLYGEDFFKSKPLPPTQNARWLFCNPPYNERIKVKEPVMELYGKLFAAAEEVARPDRACFILPAKGVKGRLALPRGWRVLQKRPFLNGGIPVVAFVFGRLP